MQILFLLLLLCLLGSSSLAIPATSPGHPTFPPGFDSRTVNPKKLEIPSFDPSKDRGGKAEIIWDEYGVPHIHATDSPSLFYAFGWSQAKDHGDAILRLFGASRARSAELWGAWFLEVDKFILTLGSVDMGEFFYGKSQGWSRVVLDSFAAGMNEYIEEHPDKIAPDAYKAYPVSGLDVATHAAFAMQMFSSQTLPRRLFDALQEVQQTAEKSGESLPFNPTEFMETYLAALDAAGEFEKFREAPTAEGGFIHTVSPMGGSNAMAAIRHKGGSFLHINPHLLWTPGAMTFYEAQLVIEDPQAPEAERVNFYGAALLGMPIMALGFNHFGGWAHTVNTVSPYSLYEITVAPKEDDSGWKYLMDGNWHDFQVRKYTIKTLDGAPVEHTVLDSEFGRVMLLKEDAKKAFAYRFEGLVKAKEDRHWEVLEQTWNQMRSGSGPDFVATVANQQMPLFTYVYSNRDSDLFYLSNSWTPEYPSGGDWSTWTGRPYATESSKDIWKNIVPFSRQPQLLNPDGKFVSNANDPPWQATYPMFRPRPEDSPKYYSPQPDTPNNRDFTWRPKNCWRSLKEVLDENRQKGVEGMVDDQMLRASMNSEPEIHRHFLEDLLRAARNSSDPWARKAIPVLTEWDRLFIPESRGALLFGRWFQAYNFAGDLEYTVPWDKEDPANTPRGIPTQRIATALAALITEAEEMETEDGFPLDLPMGDFLKLPKAADGRNYPVSGCPGVLGCVRTTQVGLKPTMPGQKTSEAQWGDTFKAVIEFPEDRTERIRALAQTGYGQASQPGHPHNGDQWKIYSERVYRKLSLWREELLGKAESITHLTRKPAQ